jgi:hypothetical protein
VDLSNNALSGTLPDNWTLLETVVALDLSGASRCVCWQATDYKT